MRGSSRQRISWLIALAILIGSLQTAFAMNPDPDDAIQDCQILFWQSGEFDMTGSTDEELSGINLHHPTCLVSCQNAPVVSPFLALLSSWTLAQITSPLRQDAIVTRYPKPLKRPPKS